MSRFLLLAWAALFSCSAFAQSLLVPDPVAVYNEADPAAWAQHPGPGRNSQWRQMLDARIRGNPRDVAALTQRGYIRRMSGHEEGASRDFERAMALTVRDAVGRRRLLWTMGWSEFNRDNFAEAIELWKVSAALHGGRPFWLAYTMAVATWGLGERDVAVDWFDAAVRSNSEWGDLNALRARTRHWNDREREMAEAALQAWQDRSTAKTPGATQG